MSADLKALVTQCEACAKYAPRQQKEPLMQPDTPQRAWNSVSADIMSLRGKEYLVTVDALSGFFEIDLLRQQTAAEVIIKLKMHFARYGTPMTLATDNGPQFASKQFAEFAKKWRFDHRTSSPHYPRTNGQAEAAVKVAKSILRKVQHEKSDVYMALWTIEIVTYQSQVRKQKNTNIVVFVLCIYFHLFTYIQCINDIHYAASCFSTKYLLPLLSLLIDPKYAVVPSCLLLS